MKIKTLKMKTIIITQYQENMNIKTQNQNQNQNQNHIPKQREKSR